MVHVLWGEHKLQFGLCVNGDFMIGKPGPFQIIDSDGAVVAESPLEPPRRQYSCANYTACLSVACALNWDSFTCRGCNLEVNDALLWRAHQALKRDNVANKLCELPHIRFTVAPENEVVQRKVVGEK